MVHQGDMEALCEHHHLLENGHGEEMVNGLDAGWMRVSSILDSGPAESEAPPTTCEPVPLNEASGSRAGLAANDWAIKVNVTCGLRWKDVTKPLNSVSKMCDAGNVVAFTAEGAPSRICGGALRCTSEMSRVCMC